LLISLLNFFVIIVVTIVVIIVFVVVIIAVIIVVNIIVIIVVNIIVIIVVIFVVEESGQLAPVSVLSRGSVTDQETVTTLTDDYSVGTDAVTLVQPVSVTSDMPCGHLEQVTTHGQSTVESEVGHLV